VIAGRGASTYSKTIKHADWGIATWVHSAVIRTSARPAIWLASIDEPPNLLPPSDVHAVERAPTAFAAACRASSGNAERPISESLVRPAPRPAFTD
jgi:hypothetical protein